MKLIKISDQLSGRNSNKIVLFKTGFNKEYNDTLGLIVRNVFPESYDTSNFRTFSSWKKSNVLELKFEEIRKLERTLISSLVILRHEYINEYRGAFPSFVTGWVNVLKKFDGDHQPHRHHLSPFNLVAVYYSDGDFERGGGATRFFLDDSNKEIIQDFNPEAGDLILFPANMLHSILAYCSERPRITFCFDLRLKMSDFYGFPAKKIEE